MKVNGSIKVKSKLNGLEYRLYAKEKDAYYLTCNDGLVPSGQMIYRTEQELDEMFEEVK